MKAYQLQAIQSLDSVIRVERDVPEPRAGEVLIRVRACSLNFRDTLVARGAYGGPPPAGLVPLSDGAGEVVAIGAGVTRVAVGDRVAGIFMQRWLAGEITSEGATSALGGAIDGMLAEHVVLSQDGVVKIPSHLTFEEAASLPCAAVTAWNALVRESHVKAGDTVLLLGTGGVSMIGLQLAKMHGARCIVTSSSDEKLERAKALGADAVVNYRERPDWEKAVLELTNGRGADIVLEVGGVGTLDKSLASTRLGGHVCLIGVLTGVSGQVATSAILRKHLRVHGIYVGSREMFEEMNRAIEQSGMRPPIGARFGFDEARAAYDHMVAGAHFGKIVVSV
jgi:NADPH:quinone reductase-like Zn-dependent oxidoreductase